MLASFSRPEALLFGMKRPFIVVLLLGGRFIKRIYPIAEWSSGDSLLSKTWWRWCFTIGFSRESKMLTAKTSFFGSHTSTSIPYICMNEALNALSEKEVG